MGVSLFIVYSSVFLTGPESSIYSRRVTIFGGTEILTNFYTQNNQFFDLSRVKKLCDEFFFEMRKAALFRSDLKTVAECYFIKAICI